MRMLDAAVRRSSHDTIMLGADRPATWQLPQPIGKLGEARHAPLADGPAWVCTAARQRWWLMKGWASD
jgi:hypothetical protein